MEQKEAEWNGRKEKKQKQIKLVDTFWKNLPFISPHCHKFTTLTPFFFQIKKEKAKKMYIKKNKNIKNNKKFF